MQGICAAYFWNVNCTCSKWRQGWSFGNSCKFIRRCDSAIVRSSCAMVTGYLIQGMSGYSSKFKLYHWFVIRTNRKFIQTFDLICCITSIQWNKSIDTVLHLLRREPRHCLMPPWLRVAFLSKPIAMSFWTANYGYAKYEHLSKSY